MFVVATAVACQPKPTPPPPAMPTQVAPITLRIGLTDSALSLAALVTFPFSHYNDQINLQFVPANDAALLADLQDGQLDAILIHHLPPERALWFNPVALDGLVLLVHPDNPATDLALSTAQAIFSGEFKQWSQIGGADEPINLLSREAGSGAREIFTQQYPLSAPLYFVTKTEPQDELRVFLGWLQSEMGQAVLGERYGRIR